ncbi:MAG: YHS domain-containing protein [Nitrosopumilaceae archaeon]
MKDPVCGSEVDEKSEAVVYDNKKYHFCCASCRWAFEKDPKQFVGEQK